MITILLTSKNSFLSKEISKAITDCSFVYLDRLSLLNTFDIVSKIKNYKVDYIIHSSWAGVGAGTFSDYVYNLSVHENLKNVSHLVKKIFIFGSGAEFLETNLVSESDLPLRNLSSYYSSAKCKISWDAREINNFINLRLFGCFGKEEDSNRFIKQSMLNIHSNKDILIHKDREMDFFYVEDLITLIKIYINELKSNLPKELNCVYKEKFKLLDIAKLLVQKYSPNTQIKIVNKDYDKPYTSKSKLIDSLNLTFKGLQKGIEEIYGY